MKNEKKIFLIIFIILIIINLIITTGLTFNLIRRDLKGNIIPVHRITLSVILNFILHIIVLFIGCYTLIKSKSTVLDIIIIFFLGVLPILILLFRYQVLQTIQTSGNIFIWLIQNGILII